MIPTLPAHASRNTANREPPSNTNSNTLTLTLTRALRLRDSRGDVPPYPSYMRLFASASPLLADGLFGSSFSASS